MDLAQRIIKDFQGRVGLALGSGSARGWAHIGVIKALAEAGIGVDCIAGTSIGALVGAVLANDGIPTLEEVALGLDWRQIGTFFDLVLPKSGLLDGKKVSAFIRDYVGPLDIQDLPRPFKAVATDLTSGQGVVIDRGDVIEAVRASVSVPGIFTPVSKGGRILADGALVNPVPVDVVREMGAGFVIAVDLNHHLMTRRKPWSTTPEQDSKRKARRPRLLADQRIKVLELLNRRFETIEFPALTQIRRWADREPLPNIFEVLITSINIMETRITETNLLADPPDLLIRPDLGHIRFLEFNRAAETIAEGYRAAREALSDRT